MENNLRKARFRRQAPIAIVRRVTIKRTFINLLSDDLDRARQFYVDLLGFRVAFKSDWFVHLAAPDNPSLELGLLLRTTTVVPEAARPRPIGGLLTFVVDDVDAVRERARELGVSVLEEPENLFYGQRRMLLRDPDGMILDVSSECPPDPTWASRVQQTADGSYEER